MILTAVTIATIGLFVGWTGGLALHALRCTRWQDPGARLAGGIGVVAVIVTCVICAAIAIIVGAVALNLPVLAGVALLLAPIPVGSAAGRWASARIAQLSLPRNDVPDDLRHAAPRTP